MTQDCDLIGHVIVSDILSDVVRGIARLTLSENIGHISHISKIVRHCTYLPQYLDALSHITVEDCAYFEHADNFRHLDLIVLIFRLVHTSSLLFDHIGFCTDESVLMLTLPAVVIEIRSRVGLFAHENVTSIAIITNIVTPGTPCHEWTTSLQLSQLAIDGCTYRYDFRMIEEFRSHRHMLSLIDRHCLDFVVYGATTNGEALCCRATLVSPLSRARRAVLSADAWTGAVLVAARRLEVTRYPVLTCMRRASTARCPRCGSRGPLERRVPAVPPYPAPASCPTRRAGRAAAGVCRRLLQRAVASALGVWSMPALPGAPKCAPIG